MKKTEEGEMEEPQELCTGFVIFIIIINKYAFWW